MRGEQDILNPGRLRNMVVVQSYTSTFVKGREARGYTKFPADHCEIESLTGRELQAAQAVSSEVQFRLTFRYRPQYRANMRVLFGSRIFEILAPLHDENRHTKTELLCKEVNG